MNTDFTVGVSLQDSSGIPSTNTCQLSLSSDQSNLFESSGGALSVDVTSGDHTFTVYMNTHAVSVLTVTCSQSGEADINNPYSMDVQPLTLSVTSVPTTTISTNDRTLSFVAGFYYADGTLATQGSNTVELSLNTGDFSYGGVTGSTISGTTVGGVVRFENVQILTEGSLTVTASAGGVTSSASSAFSVVNFVYSAGLAASPSSPYANFDFMVTATLSRAGGLTSTTACSYSLTGSFHGGSITGSTTDSSVRMTIYSSSAGDLALSFTCTQSGQTDVTASATVTIQQLTLVITTFTSPANSLAQFDLVVGVYDQNGGNLEDTNGSYAVVVELSPSGSFKTSDGTVSSRLSLTARGGVATVNSLRIVSENASYTLKATCTGVIEADSSAFAVYNYVYAIVLSTSTATPGANFAFNVQADLYGEDKTLTTRACTITFSGSNTIYEASGGTLSADSSASSVTISIYSWTTGSLIITATCPQDGNSPEVSNTTTVTVGALQPQIDSLSLTVLFT
jgi:hypothetical protein